jgi:hypothetical protein
MNKIALSVLSGCVLLFSNCKSSLINPQDVYVVPGPAPVVMSTDECASTCKFLRDNQCTLGFAFDSSNKQCDNESNPTCTTCERFCKETIQNNIWLDIDCIVLLKNLTPPDCNEIEQCAIREKRSSEIDIP